MPPKRSTRTAARQGTLSFSKGQANRVTKQAGPAPVKKLSSAVKPDTVALQPPPAADPLSAPEPDSPTTVLGGRSSPAPDTAQEDPQEQADTLAASKVSGAKIKAYWRAKEQARLAPRVHQKELSLGEKVLREWDMSGQFGPCIGISRERRWRRARRLGLEPPVEVLAVLLGQLEKEEVEERAYVDVLMGNRVEVVA